MKMQNGSRQQTATGMLLRGLQIRFFLPVLCCAISACGFQPRGSSALPLEMALTYINSGKPYASLVDDFSAALRVHGGRVTRDLSEATAVLNIISDRVDRRLLSINTGGKVLEYEVRQTIRFSVATHDNLPLLAEQEVSLGKSYLYTSTDVLGKEREDRVLRQTLQRNLVDLALLRITAAARELRWSASGSPIQQPASD